MNLPKLAVSRPITTFMALLSVLVIGGIAMVRLPLDFLPRLDLPFIAIIVPYPNSSPIQIEKEITKPVEEVLSTLSGVKKLRSISGVDQAEFELQFQWGEDLDIVRMQVSEKMEQVKGSLPEGIGEVLIFSFNTSDIPVVQGRISAQGVDLSGNYELLETRVVNRIRRVPGVARVDLLGVAPHEVRIDLILDRIKEHNVDAGALIERLSGASSNLVLGQIRHGGLRFSARAVGAFDSLQSIQDMPVNERGLKLSEIAEISYEEPLIRFGRHLNRSYAVGLDVYKESTANTVEVVQKVMRVIHEDIDGDPLLQGVNLFVFQDQAKEITRGIDGLLRSGLIGGFLAILVLYFFLRRFDATLIVSLSIPFSIIAACGVLFFMGKTLNILSMMGLMLGIGMLVDNAVVVLESIERRYRDNVSARRAALEGSNGVLLAVISATLTSVIVFLPLIVGGRSELTTWLQEVGITISIALLCSLFSSLTLIPLMSTYLLRQRVTPTPPSLAWLERRYVLALRWTLRHKVWTFVLLILSLGVGIVPFVAELVDTSPFAAAINRRLFLNYEFSDFVYKLEAERAVSQVEEYLFAHKEEFQFRSIYSFYGENEAGTVINMMREDLGDEAIRDLRQKIRADLPDLAGVRIYFHEDAEMGGDSTYFALKFYGADGETLRGVARTAEALLESTPGVEDISSSFTKGRKEIQVRIDRAKARLYGLSAQDVSDIFSFTLGGLRLRRFNTGEREVETWVALRLEDRQSLDDLQQLAIRTEDGRSLRLGDIAAFEIVRSPLEIVRENRKIRVALNATYEGEKWAEVREEIEKGVDALHLPPGTSWSWDDRILEQDTQNREMGINFLLAILLVYIVMASLFESVTQPLAILFSIPFAVPGAAWLLAATGSPFNMMSQIGLLILMGIVVNNGIVLLDHLNQLRRSGMPRDEAILQAGRDRLRPILMTAITTVVGLIPLAVGTTGVGGVYYYPLARTVIGGLLSSTVLTLVVLPYINLGIEAATLWLGRIWNFSAAIPLPASQKS